MSNHVKTSEALSGPHEEPWPTGFQCSLCIPPFLGARKQHRKKKVISETFCTLQGLGWGKGGWKLESKLGLVIVIKKSHLPSNANIGNEKPYRSRETAVKRINGCVFVNVSFKRLI